MTMSAVSVSPSAQTTADCFGSASTPPLRGPVADRPDPRHPPAVAAGWRDGCRSPDADAVFDLRRRPSVQARESTIGCGADLGDLQLPARLDHWVSEVQAAQRPDRVRLQRQTGAHRVQFFGPLQQPHLDAGTHQRDGRSQAADACPGPRRRSVCRRPGRRPGCSPGRRGSRARCSPADARACPVALAAVRGVRT